MQCCGGGVGGARCRLVFLSSRQKNIHKQTHIHIFRAEYVVRISFLDRQIQFKFKLDDKKNSHKHFAYLASATAMSIHIRTNETIFKKSDTILVPATCPIVPVEDATVDIAQDALSLLDRQQATPPIDIPFGGGSNLSNYSAEEYYYERRAAAAAAMIRGYKVQAPETTMTTTTAAAAVSPPIDHNAIYKLRRQRRFINNAKCTMVNCSEIGSGFYNQLTSHR